MSELGVTSEKKLRLEAEELSEPGANSDRSRRLKFGRSKGKASERFKPKDITKGGYSKMSQHETGIRFENYF
ncbi:hypothetical protein [Mesobacillus jeotgali]|uniref:hypothetical protein n=1 Tax=Mesobacillus jeotgali TaxID=129985 RepID=UPI0009A5B633|nr:hypothetical protein [Mesobacillus jeotgali]